MADQEALRFEHPVGRIRELAHHLQYESLVRIWRRAEDPESTRVQFDDKQRVICDDAADSPDLCREKIRRDGRAPIRRQKCLPGRRPLITRWDAVLLEDCGDVDRATRCPRFFKAPWRRV